jgi:hypothetical protein
MTVIIPPERRTPEAAHDKDVGIFVEEGETEMAEGSKVVTVGDETVKVTEAPGWKNWRTLAFGALVTVLGGLQMTDLAVIIPPAYTGLAMTVLGGIVIWLRTITTGPVMSNVQVKKIG